MEISPIAHLQTILCDPLSNGDKHEAAKLLKAASLDGFFYLDLQGSAFAALIDVTEDVFALSKALFGLSEEEKLRYDIDELGRLKLNGYYSHLHRQSFRHANHACSATSPLAGTLEVRLLAPHCLCRHSHSIVRCQRQARRL